MYVYASNINVLFLPLFAYCTQTIELGCRDSPIGTFTLRGEYTEFVGGPSSPCFMRHYYCMITIHCSVGQSPGFPYNRLTVVLRSVMVESCLLYYSYCIRNMYVSIKSCVHTTHTHTYKQIHKHVNTYKTTHTPNSDIT